MTAKKIKVNKLDAARRQLRTAIVMWFREEDPVSIHTLGAAASQVISDLMRHQGLPDFLYGNPRIRPEMRREYVRAVRAAANFFKHADDDPEGEHEFNPAINDFQILGLLEGMRQLGVVFNDDEDAFWTRFGLEYPDLLVGDPYAAMPAEWLRDISSWTRLEFYETHRTNAAIQRAKSRL
jgi:hypothetical protein